MDDNKDVRIRNDGLEFVAGALKGGGAGRMRVNIVKENETKINCEVCRNGSIRKV